VTVDRIERRFAELAKEKRAALVVYLVVGDPSVEDSKACVAFPSAIPRRTDP
jgi:tryptophan synthase alpha subunit